MKKYVCIGAEVISKSDKQHHWISAHKLPGLYGVDRRECYFIHDEKEVDHSGLHHSRDLIILLPDYYGDYEVDESLTMVKYLNLPECESLFLDEEWKPSILAIIFWIIFAVGIIYMVLGIK